MKKFFTYFISIIQYVSLFNFILLTIIFINCFNLSFYEKFYKLENIAGNIGTNYETLIFNTKNLLNFLNYKEDLNVDWFSQKDIAHMIDVRNLYSYFYNFTLYSAIIFLLTTLVLIIIYKKEFLKFSTNLFNKILIGYLVLIFAISTIIAINFEKFWLTFHQVLFSNDLWLLSPDESNLIQMVPENFFISLITRIIIQIIIILIILFAANLFLKKAINK